ncbi:MAG: WbuC family cupin fold metalloprotein, partial [Chloroflexi bacterium]|nr:WbuC family cupin fold metalloprotein [Chloroflexota bacterium]
MIHRITDQLLDSLMERARRSPRKRVMHTFHSGPWEHAHRMLNVITPGSYTQPHRHLDPHKSEGFVILRGRVAVVIFDDSGAVDRGQTTVLEQGSSITGIDIGPNTWHTLVAYEDSALYEVKGQPSQGYDQGRIG